METQPRVINFLSEAEVGIINSKLKYVHSDSAINILFYLIESGMAYTREISEACCISESLVSTTLCKLMNSGLLTKERIGSSVYYSCVNPEAIKTILETALKL